MKDYITLYSYILQYILSYQTNVFFTFKTKAFDFVSVLLIFWRLHKRSQVTVTPEDICIVFAVIMNCVADILLCMSFGETRQQLPCVVPRAWHLWWQINPRICWRSSLRKTPLTSRPPHLQHAWEKSHQVASASTNTGEASLWETNRREAGDGDGRWTVSRREPSWVSSPAGFDCTC